MQVPDVTIEQAQRIGLDVLNWRFEGLLKAGYPVDISIMLAEQSGVNLHEACDLLRDGATIHQALRILL